LETVIARQLTRDNGQVPEEAVRRQYMSLQYPFIGEVDNIIVDPSNLVE
jgi:hypothetical protein